MMIRTLRDMCRRFEDQCFIAVATILTVLAVAYWSLWASDRYVSEAHVVIQSTSLSGTSTPDFSSLLTGGSSGESRDQLMLRDYLLSVDMLNKLDNRLNLRDHYSSHQYDIVSRMWSRDISLEWFHRHYLSRVEVIFDDYAGVLVLKVQAYTPDMAQRIAAMLVEEGEAYMNELARRLAREQVGFLEKQVAQLNEQLITARQAVLSYQNKKGLVSPEGKVQSLATIIANLESQITDLKAKRQAMLGYLSPDAPDVAQVNLAIAGIEKQLEQEQARLASPKGQALNRTVEEYQRLEAEAGFIQDVYRTALAALEQVRIESLRNLRQISVLQTPTLPQYPLRPERIYNSVVFALTAFLLAGIVQLLAAIIRDHKD